MQEPYALGCDANHKLTVAAAASAYILALLRCEPREQAKQYAL